MAIKVNFNVKNLIPDKTILGEAIVTGIFASLILFLVDFFGIQKVMDIIPEGFELFVLVLVAVYVKHLISVHLNGKEVV